MRFFPAFALVTLAGGLIPCLPLNADPVKQGEPDLTAYNGAYFYSPSCTDECATLTVHFERIPKEHRVSEFLPWTADGEIKDSIRRNLVKFTGAEVRAGDDGSIIVWASCVSFKINRNGDALEFRGYDRVYQRDRDTKR
jgi:hypothetical protein